jgi:hypothetical protein
VTDLPGDVDVVATSAARFRSRLLEGDDFAQWTLRCACILYDAGPLRDGVRLIAETGLWPDPQRKLGILESHRAELERLIEMGDESAAHEQLRAMLTTAARGLLLQVRVFPLAREELPAQLQRAGYDQLAQALDRNIHSAPERDELEGGLRALDATLESSRAPLPA